MVSTLNAYDGAVTSNMAIVPAGNQGKVDAFAQGTMNLLLDISSYVLRRAVVLLMVEGLA